MAQKQGRTEKIRTIVLADLTGGMNTTTSPEFIKDDEAVIIQNMEFDVDGNQLRTRRGLGKPLHTFTSQISYVYNDYEVNTFFVFLEDKSIYRYEMGGTPTFIGKLNGVAKRPTCTKWGGNLLIASGSKLQKYDYHSVTEITDSPNCDIVFNRGGRVVVAKSGSDLLVYSAIGDESNWTINSNDPSARKDVNVGYKDGGDIVAVAELASDVLVFKSNGLIYDVQNEPEDWSITLLGTDSDFITRYACKNINNDTVFLATSGVKSVQSSQVYANFTTKDIGYKINLGDYPIDSNGFISNLRRTKQMVINGNSEKELYVFHYGLKAFTKWVFPYDISSICENQYHTLVAGNQGGKGYLFNFNDTTDNGIKIPQLITSKELRDTHKLNAYRTYIDVGCTNEGVGHIYVNDVDLLCEWQPNNDIGNQSWQKEFKTQILSPILQFKFTTDDTITFKYVSFDVVMQRESMVRSSSSSGGKKGGFGKSRRRRKSGHDDFLKGVKSKGGSPYS